MLRTLLGGVVHRIISGRRGTAQDYESHLSDILFPLSSGKSVLIQGL